MVRVQQQFLLRPISLISLLLCVQLVPLAEAKGPSGVELGKLIQPLVDAHEGKVAVAIKHLPTGEKFEYQADTPMPTASLIKLPLMVATYQAVEEGKLTLDQMIELKEEDKVPGSGILTPHFSPGTKLSLHDAIRLMIAYSDNTATNLVVDQVGLPATAEMMDKLDCPNTKLHSKVYRRDTSIFPERSKQFGLGSTSAADMVRLLGAINEGKLVSQQACQQMREHLYECTDRDMCARGLPAGAKFAQKTGAVSAVRTNAGLIEGPSGAIAICVLTADNEDQSWVRDNEAQVLCGAIAKAAYEFFNPDPATEAAADGQLAVGANGRLVEALQRTLNARSKPSPGLATDGDFGPNTERAVKAFQRQKELPDTGIIDEATWEALGPLLTEEAPLPAPEETNSAKLKTAPADKLDGPPYVTCKAWAIGNLEDGKVLWGENTETPLDIASTTKMMTAYVVSKLAEKDPSVLDETVTFSQRADDTIGSTSGVRVGEKLPVGELLYGLMLPSGNDASVALAEHFGPRLGEGSDGDGYEKFIAEMNRQAKQIGMTESNFENTSGLTSKDHKVSARDLLILAQHVMQQPLLKKIVATRQHGYTVEGPGGYKRNLVWRNTNRLLRTEGYLGVKTGTTSAAGACLVSCGERDGQQLIIVVLGSSSGDARYADTRNLYRWAWQQLGGK